MKAHLSQPCIGRQTRHRSTSFGAWAAGLAAIAAAILGDLHSGAQEFRSGVTLRVLDVVVTDASGRPVRNLGQADFAITEDGTPVTIRFVTPFDVAPVTALEGSGAAGGDTTDVWTNMGAETRRVFAVVLDDLNTRASETARARAALQAFIDRLPEGDLASIVFTGQQAGAQEFTSDKARLTQSLRQYTGRYSLPEPDLVTEGSPGDVDRAMRATLPGEAAGNHQRVLQTLVNVTDWLSSIQDRRKSILFVTAGLEPALSQAFLSGLDDGTFSGTGVRGLFGRLVERAAAANVAIYPLDYRGLSVPLSRSSLQSDGGPNALVVMADQTGGVALINNNDPGRLFDRLIEDASAYYLVGYEPPPDARKDRKARSHRLEVRMRPSALSARARRTYVSPAPGTGANRTARAELLASPLPGGALGLHVQVSAFAKANGRARAIVVLEVDGDGLAPVLDGQNGTVTVSYRVAATDVNGRVQAADARDVTLRLTRARLRQIAEQRLRIFSSLDLPPGSFRVRAGVVQGDRHGVVAGDVDVPDYKDAPLVLSHPLVISTGTAASPVRREDFEPFKGRLSAAPTAVRVFEAGEALELYAEVSARARGKRSRSSEPAPLVGVAVLDASGTEVAAVPAGVGPAGPGLGGGRVHPVRASQSLRGLQSGRYVLELTVEVGDRPALTRRVAFEIR